MSKTTEQMCSTREGRMRMLDVASSLGILAGCVGTVVLYTWLEDAVKFAVISAVILAIVQWTRATMYEARISPTERAEP